MAIAQSFNSVMITTADPGGDGPKIIYCNPALCKMTGYSQEYLIGKSPRILQGPLTDKAVLNKLRRCLRSGSDFQGSTLNYRRDGTPYFVEWNISPVRGASGKVEYFVSVQRDITARILAEQRQELLAQALNVTQDAVVIVDDRGRILFTNQAFQRVTGYSPEDAQALAMHAATTASPHPAFYRNLLRVMQGSRRLRVTFEGDGPAQDRPMHLEQVVTILKDKSGAGKHYVSVLKDISSFVERENLLSRQVRSDVLTGLLNRRGGSMKLRSVHRAAQRAGSAYAVILADIDNFKMINDRYGHDTGDVVLRQSAAVLIGTIGGEGAIARWGGEEFLFLLPDGSLAEAMGLAERVRMAIAAHDYPIAGRVTLSLGVGVWEGSETAHALVRRVDQALYRAKNEGRDRVVAAE
nr:diguanylate cyclase [Kaistia adipata]